MTWVDYAVAGVFVISALLGIWRGFTREILSLLTWVGAFIAAALWGGQGAAWFERWIADTALREAAGTASVFFIALFVGAVLSHFVVVAVRDSRFSATDRTLGGGLGLIRAVLLVALFVLVAQRLELRQTPSMQASILLPRFAPLAQGLATVIPARWLEWLQPDAPTSNPTPAVSPDVQEAS